MAIKILLLGNTGQLGWELNRTLLTLGELTALDYPEIDMADETSIRAIVQDAQPDLIVNATAYTNVDGAETEKELAMAINGRGPGILAEEAEKRGAALIHYSTDYVFDGKKGSPYTEQDAPNPINFYGESKLAGEEAIQAVGGAYLLFRTSWVYSTRRPCFVTKVLKWAEKREVLRIVDDQISTPTWCRSLAEATTHVVAQWRGDPIGWIAEKSGMYHLTDGGSCSRFKWAQEIIRNSQFDGKVMVEPAKSADFPTMAVRPSKSELDRSFFLKTFYLLINEWRNNLKIAMDLMTN